MSFKDGRIGVGKDPIFPLDISGSCRIDGDLILGGRFSDSQGNPIQLGSGSGATSTPDQNQDGVPSWSSNSLTTVYGYKNTGAHPSTISNGYNWAGSTWNDDGTITWSAGTGGTAGGMAPAGGWDANTTYILTVTSKTTGGSYTLGGTSFNPGTSYATQTKEFTGSLGEMRNNWGSSNQITFQRWDVSIKNKKMLNVHQLGGVGINDDRVYDEDFGHLYIDTTDFPTLRRGGKDYTSSSVLTVGGSIILSAINGTNSQSTSNIYFNAPNNKFQTGLIWRREVSGLTTYISGAILFDSELTNYSTTTTTGYSAGGLSFYTSDAGSGWSSSSAKRRMVIHGGGNVGIGTTSPDSKLHIKGSSSDNCTIRLTNSNAGTGFMYIQRNDDGKSYVLNGSNHPLILGGNNNTSQLYLKENGNIGIGTTSPNAKLDVNGNIYANGLIYLSDYIQHIGDSNTKIGFPSNDNIYFYCAGTVQMRINNNGVGIHTDAPANSSTRFQVGGNVYVSGNVGIGTTSPNTKLEINGGTYTGDPTNHVAQLLRLTQEYSQDWASAGHEGGVGMQFLIDNQNQNYWPIGEIYFYCSNNDNSETDGSLRFRVSNNNDTSGSASDRANVDAMTIHHTGNVGIGTNSPSYALSFGQSHDGDAMWNAGKGIIACYEETSTGKYFYGMGIGSSGSSPNDTGGLCLWGGTGGSVPSNSNCHLFIKRDDGNVGIGTTSPNYPLHIYGSTVGVNGYVSYIEYPNLSTAYAANHNVGLRVEKDIWTGQYVLASSDRRIKENIVDVSDNQALSMLRDIPCRYYEYKDKINRGTDKTIGFIAQEVREILPMAVSLQTNVIPNEMRKLENISWEEIKDNSDNIINYKLTSDLSDCSGIKYRFYVTNDPSGNDECKKEIIGNSDNTFTFDQSWNNVFCYGKEVDDFHTLDKQKLFSLNFSATQELDRKVTALETVGIQDRDVKILDLYKENQDQNVKILDLYKENEALKARLAKLEAFLGI